MSAPDGEQTLFDLSGDAEKTAHISSGPGGELEPGAERGPGGDDTDDPHPDLPSDGDPGLASDGVPAVESDGEAGFPSAGGPATASDGGSSSKSDGGSSSGPDGEFGPPLYGAAHGQGFSWDGEQVDYSDAMLDRGRAYGSYVITSRAIPDVRDGLKPVQRRIIVAMDDLGLRSDRKYAKSAKTVGTVIGNYHPHGDSAVYDAMVRMAQPWQSNLPLVDGQGNWGNLHNEAPAAAQRYTESRLAPPASAMLADLRPEIVDYEWNFDETRQMPAVLPVTFPNLLVNGSMGVAWAMACSIPPHNAGEVLDAALLVLDDPEVPLERLLAVMPGPDLPGGGIVVNPENLASIYATGRGTVLVQGRVEQMPGQQTLRITQLPYQVSAKSIVEQAVAGAKGGKITEIYTAELPRNLTDASGVDVQVKCKRGGSIARLAEELFQHTKLRDTLAFNFTVLVDNAPQTLSLREILVHFVDFRRQVVTRRLRYERDVLHQRLHLLLAERAAADVIDRVVQIIRSATDDDDSKAKLMAELRYVPHGQRRAVPIDDVQAQHVIDMALKKINALNQLKIDEELRAKSARIEAIDAVLGSPGGVTDAVRAELGAARKQFARPRRTVIPKPSAPGAGGPGTGSGAPGTRAPGAAAPAAGPGTASFVLGGDVYAEAVWVFVASDGATLLTKQGTKPLASSPLRLSGDAILAAVVGARSDESLLLFTEQGRAYRVTLSEHPVSSSGAGRRVVHLAGDRVVTAFCGADAPYYLIVTEQGQIKRLPAKTLAGAHGQGIVCCRVPDGDRVVAVVPHDEDDDVLLARAQGKVLRIETGAKLRPVVSATAGTVAGARLDAGDRVVAAVRAEGTSLVSLHRSGMALCVALGEYPVKSRGTGGVQSVAVDRPARRPAGRLALVLCQRPDVPATVFTDRGSLQRLEPAALPLLHRATTSRPLLVLGPGEIPAGQVVTEPLA